MVGHEALDLGVVVRIHRGQRFDALALRARLLTVLNLSKDSSQVVRRQASAENKSRASEERSDERVEGWFGKCGTSIC